MFLLLFIVFVYVGSKLLAQRHSHVIAHLITSASLHKWSRHFKSSYKFFFSLSVCMFLVRTKLWFESIKSNTHLTMFKIFSSIALANCACGAFHSEIPVFNLTHRQSIAKVWKKSPTKRDNKRGESNKKNSFFDSKEL